MGYTDFSKRLIEKVLQDSPVKNVIDLGAQNDFSGPNLPAPYISEWYKEKGIEYACIDLNGENGASTQDLSKVFKSPWGFKWDMVCDFGTSEHVGREGKFNWEAIYNCWVNKWNLLKVGGVMVNENPFEKNWPGHGFNYYTREFYLEMENISPCNILELGIHPAMSNVTDGWNVFCVLRKRADLFMSLESFKKLSLKQA